MKELIDPQKYFGIEKGYFETQFGITTILHESAWIPRYLGKDYPEEIFGDGSEKVVENLATHILNLASLGYVVGENNEFLDKKKMCNMAFIHDVQEIKLLDKPGPDKEGIGTVSANEEENELNAARSEILKARLSVDEIKLWREFERADKFLKTGEGDIDTLSPEAIILVVLDKSLGNTVAHHVIVEWMNSWEYDKNVIIPVRCMEFTYDQYEEFVKNISVFEETNNDVYELGIKLLNQMIDYVEEAWGLVEKEKIPEVMQKYLI